MRGFDASSMIYAWDNYPPKQFPPLWRWVAAQIESRELVMSQVAYEEVGQKIPECTKWLLDEGVHRVPVSSYILQESLRINSLLTIVGDKYYGNGVNENDILIIATAKVDGHELVSNEKRQPLLPDNLKRYKIPAVCALESVGVPCMSFIDLIRGSGEVFGA